VNRSSNRRRIAPRDRLPSNELPDTEEIVLQVCKTEGLQQIIWISKLLSTSEERVQLESILAEGTRRYGKPEVAEQGVIHWNGGQTMVAAVSIKAFIAYSWQAMDRDSMLVLRSTGTQ
jgi:hypothetical protein